MLCITDLFIHPTRPTFFGGRFILIKYAVYSLGAKLIRKMKNPLNVFNIILAITDKNLSK
jgi:hypothetical protein